MEVTSGTTSETGVCGVLRCDECDVAWLPLDPTGAEGVCFSVRGGAGGGGSLSLAEVAVLPGVRHLSPVARSAGNPGGGRSPRGGDDEGGYSIASHVLGAFKNPIGPAVKNHRGCDVVFGRSRRLARFRPFSPTALRAGTPGGARFPGGG